jgi:aminodeoxyfutalosine deaminase
MARDAKVPLSARLMSKLARMRFLKAVKIFDGIRYLPDESVIVHENGTIREITTAAAIDPLKLEMLEGILMPGFVNAHCHLELSHMKGQTEPGKGLPAFGLEIVKKRALSPDGQIVEHMQDADREMQTNGIVAVGDICNHSTSAEVKRNSAIFYHSFAELIGFNPLSAEDIFTKGLGLLGELVSAGGSQSLAAHAPYSVSPALLRMIVNHNTSNELPFSMHYNESEEEGRFLRGERSAFQDLYRQLGIDISWFRPNGDSTHLSGKLPQTSPAMLVHNTCNTEDDVKQLFSPNLFFCFCPSANLYIQERLPQVSLYMNIPDNVCIGTDSLASNDSLDLLKEANLLAGSLMAADSPLILKALTFNGARALNIAHNFGRLIPGTRPGMNLVKMQEGRLRLLKTIG